MKEYWSSKKSIDTLAMAPVCPVIDWIGDAMACHFNGTNKSVSADISYQHADVMANISRDVLTLRRASGDITWREEGYTVVGITGYGNATNNVIVTGDGYGLLYSPMAKVKADMAPLNINGEF